MNEFINTIHDYVWGIWLIVLILLCGIILSFRTKFIQVRRLGTALRFMIKNEEKGHGEVSSFAALCTALSATVGTGNIVGVATAVGTGGPGSLFWMEIAAFLGMATKYAEGLLAVKFRKLDKNGNYIGGPFYYIELGLGRKWIPLAKIFAFFGVFVGLMGIGTFTQINGISSAVKSFFDPNNKYALNIFGTDVSFSVIITGLVVTFLVMLITIGGIKRKSSVSQVIVPIMIILYIGSCFFIVCTHFTEIPRAIVVIIESAFGVRPIAGGIVGSALVFLSMRNGIARGIFSNEAGLGSAPIAAAAAKTKEPVRQGLVSMTGTFIDTIVVCTMTGLSIVMAGSYDKGLEGVDITIDAFQYGLPFNHKVSSFILMICLAVFAFTTILGWNYYSERCLSYLTHSNKIVTKIYRWVYVLAVFIGPYMTVEAVWNIADIFNGLMAVPNVIALIGLSGTVKNETDTYLKRLKRAEHIEAIMKMKK